MVCLDTVLDLSTDGTTSPKMLVSPKATTYIVNKDQAFLKMAYTYI